MSKNKSVQTVDPNKVGRPSKYKKEHCQSLIKHMSQGLSFESFAGEIDVCDDTLYEWAKAHKEFSDAKRLAFAKNRVFWEKAGLAGMYMGGKDNPFNSTVWVFNMKNRFGWRDAKEVEVTQSTVQINIDSYDSEL